MTKTKNIGVVVFPGSNCDQDLIDAINLFDGLKAVKIWHKETKLNNLSAIVLPGGFSFGDYLRAGALAAFSPVLKEIIAFSKKGNPVLGICNGFQILIEAGLLAGSLIRNQKLKFICKTVDLKLVSKRSVFVKNANQQNTYRIPIAHHDGCFFGNDHLIDELYQKDQVVFEYANDNNNPNGSTASIAGICNKEGNVVGMMPHPERAVEAVLGSTDGRFIFESLI